MTIAGFIFIFTTLLLGFFFLQGSIIASKNFKRNLEDLKNDQTRAGTLFIIWLFIVCSLGASGVLSDFTTLPPRFLIFITLTLIGTLVLAFTSLGDLFLNGLPIYYLVGFQSFRILAELGLYSAYAEGLAPIQMTFLGMNHDIITGVSAPIVMYIMKKRESRSILLGWNILGLLLLVKIVGIAILSAPTPFRYFMNEPANTFIAQMPYILLPGILVPFAFFGHILVFRWIWRTRKVPLEFALDE